MDAGMFFIFTFNINPRVQDSSLSKVSKLWSTDHLHENLLESFKNMYILRLQHRATESESLEKRGPGNMHLTRHQELLVCTKTWDHRIIGLGIIKWSRNKRCEETKNIAVQILIKREWEPFGMLHSPKVFSSAWLIL